VTAELADERKSLLRRPAIAGPINDPNPLGLLSATLFVRARKSDAFLEQPITSRMPGSSNIADRSRVNSVHGSGNGLERQGFGFKTSKAARRRETKTTSRLVSRPNVPPMPTLPRIASAFANQFATAGRAARAAVCEQAMGIGHVTSRFNALSR